GLKVGHLDASGFTVTDGTTTYINNNLVQNAGIATDLKTHVQKLGSTAAVASNGGDALLADPAFIAPAALKIVSAWRLPHTASEVTKGTLTTSASYRRMTLITNTAGAGSGTNIVASLNATASVASRVSRAFAIAASTVPVGAIVLCSHLTIGAATGDGTDMAASDMFIAYELV
ncbi:hypothetical protein LCGC14_1773710, partial [marine sediment metagenome]